MSLNSSSISHYSNKRMHSHEDLCQKVYFPFNPLEMNVRYFFNVDRGYKHKSAIYFVEDMLVYIFRVYELKWVPPYTDHEERQRYGEFLYNFTPDIGQLLVVLKQLSSQLLSEKQLLNFLRDEYLPPEILSCIFDKLVKPDLKSKDKSWLLTFFMYLTLMSDLIVHFYHSRLLHLYVQAVSEVEYAMTHIVSEGYVSDLKTMPAYAKYLLAYYFAPAG